MAEASKTTEKAQPGPKAPVKTNKDGSARKAPVRKVRPALDLSQLTAKVASADTMREHRRERTERDQEQRVVDDLVRKAHQSWEEQGRPAVWADTRGIQIRIPEKQRETLEWRIRRAGDYFDVAIRFGKVKTEAGYATLVFIAKDRPVKDETEKKADDSNGQPGN